MRLLDVWGRGLGRREVTEQASIQLVQVRVLSLDGDESSRVLAQYAALGLKAQGVAVVGEG